MKEEEVNNSSISSLSEAKEEKTVKINVILTASEHFMFKTHTGLSKVNMQDKAKELIKEWLAKQPKLGI